MNPLRIATAFLTGIILMSGACGRQESAQSDAALARARRQDPIEAVKEQLQDCIRRYQQGIPKALPFLTASATNITIAGITRSANTNLASVDAVLLVDGKRHYLEIPSFIFPLVFIETMPPPPTETQFQQYLAQQVQRVLRGEESSLRLSPRYHWTNIVVESLTVASNYSRSYPYKAQGILLIQGLAPDTQIPIQDQLHLEIRFMEEDHWVVSYPMSPSEH